jgi:predicted enzyme related to lactoylglutathione lyase
MGLVLFAGIPVRDLAAARGWYEQLLGEPSFSPNEIEIVWTLAEDRSVYLKEDPGRAGNALVTMIVDDLDALVAEIGARGIEPSERETYSNGVRKAIYRDPEGNEVGFGGLPGKG